MELNIERNYHNGGLCCIFNHGGQEYLADICIVPGQTYTECMIFKSEDRQVTLKNADGVYCKRNIPVTEAQLTSCIEEFIVGKVLNARKEE